ncbi:MAG: protein kinase [Deltaproteobacteria bacterium]|nr:protein kinase [Deltaproteobacteria bacterium]
MADAGDTAVADEGAARRHARLMALFDEACDLAGDERAAVIARARAEDPSLGDELVELLRHDQPDALAVTREGAVGALALGVALYGEPRASLPEAIGPYRIVKLLGEGGMGMVLEAEQQAPRRRVALKLLRPERASARMLRRFRAEAEILARLNHPGIARVYEAVVDGPAPWLVMELVEGRPLDVWAARARPDLRARVEVLARVCDAVDHAHRSGVVHRDLKPANILVDAGGQPKVLDFGIARVMDPRASSDGGTPPPIGSTAPPMTALTQAGEVVGTPAYMSPEQTRFDPGAIDHRTDVYSLGVVGYELLTGQMPYEIDRADVVVSFTRIREREPLPAGRVARELRGDLELILGRALEKAPERRYTSAAALADDLRRWLRAEPVLARAPSALYQLGRFARRNRGLVIASALLLVVLVVGVVVSLTLYLRGRAYQAELVRRVDELVLLHARATLPEDPTAAVGWLSGLSPDAPWDRAWALAWDARGRGVSERRYAGHTADVEWVEASPDSARFVSASFDGTVRVTTIASGSARVLAGHDGGVNRATWSPDGSRVASAGRDGDVRVWNADGQLVASFAAHLGESEDVTWSPDGRLVASAGADGALWLGDPEAVSGRALFTVGAPLKDVLWVGDHLVTAGADHGVHVWHVGRAERTTWSGHRAVVDQLAAAPRDPDAPAGERPRIASGAADGEIRVWDADGAIRSFEAPTGGGAGAAGVKGLVFVAPGLLAAVDRAGALRLWDLATGTARELTRTGAVYRDVAVSPDGAWLATASDDRSVGLWDARTLEALTLRGHRDASLHLAFTPDGARLLSSGKDGDVRAWVLPERRTRWTLGARPSLVAGRGDRLFALDDAGTLVRVDLGSGRLDLLASDQRAMVLAASDDGARVATADRLGLVTVRGGDGAVVARAELGDRPIRLAFVPGPGEPTLIAATSGGAVALVSPTPRALPIPGERAEDLAFVAPDLLVTAHRDGHVRALTLGPADPVGRELARLEGAPPLASAPGWVAAGSRDGRAPRWTMGPDGLEPAGELRLPGPVSALGLSPAGRFAAGDRAGAIQVWSASGPRALGGHAGAVRALVWAGDGETLVSGADDGGVRVWSEGADAPAIIDVSDGPVTGLALAGPDHVVVLADAPVLGLWPVDVPRDEARVRAFLATIIHDPPPLAPTGAP